MQAVKNGIKCTLRTPGKAMLFSLILTVTAALLTVSFCVYNAVRDYLLDCEQYFHTIAELEYLGRAYPDAKIYDEAFADAVEENRALLEDLIRSDSVISYEAASAEVALSPMIHRWDNAVAEPDAAVLKVRIVSLDEQLRVYLATVTEAYYSRKDYLNRLIFVLPIDGGDILENGASYVIAGHFYKGSSPNPYLMQDRASFTEDGRLIELPDQQRIGDGEEPDDSYLRYASVLERRNNGCRVTYTAAAEDLLAFHQQLLKLTKGRFFTKEEYESKAHVCIVSERIAGMLGLDVGAVIPLEVYHSTGDIMDVSLFETADSGDYEIIGIQTDDDNWPYWIYLPDQNAAGANIRPVNGYTLGQFRIRNEAVAAFLAEAAPLIEQGFRFSVYDQGYSAATEPMQQLMLISEVFLAISLLLALCVLALQSHLFVARQRETARTMHDLGSGKTHISVYFLSAALTLTLIGAVLGALLGKRMEGRVFALLQQFADQFSDLDLRFSTSRLAIIRTLQFDPETSTRTYLTASAVLLIGSFLFTLVSSLRCLRDKKHKKKKHETRGNRHIRAGKTSRLSIAAKYGLLSIRRNVTRTIAGLLLGAVAAVFYGQLTSSLEGYRIQLTNYSKNAEITGNCTDYYGRRLSGLVLKSHPIVRLSESGLVKDCCVSVDLGHIMILGAKGKGQKHFEWPNNGFAWEAAFDRLYKEPAWTGVSSITGSPLFRYSKNGSVVWLDGWSEQDFVRTETKTFQETNHYTDEVYDVEYQGGPEICALPKDLMEERGIELGDSVEAVCAYYYNDSTILTPIQLQVVAAYVSPAKSSAVFSPVTYIRPGYYYKAFSLERQPVINGGYWFSGEKWTRQDAEQMTRLGISPYSTYSSFTFTLSDSVRLDDLRQAMDDAGYTWVHSGDRVKNFAVIDDEIYLNTRHSMQRQIQYVSVLYDALYLLSGIISFTLAWLLIQSRKKEIAVMRALGTPGMRITLNFFLEQMLIMSAGVTAGTLVSRLLGSSVTKLQLYLSLAFLAVWCLSALICIAVSLCKKSYAALTEPE